MTVLKGDNRLNDCDDCMTRLETELKKLEVISSISKLVVQQTFSDLLRSNIIASFFFCLLSG